MTVLENYNELLNTIENSSAENKDELVQFVNEQIEKENNRKERLYLRAQKKKEETEELTQYIYNLLEEDTYLTSRQVKAKVDNDEITRGMITSRLAALVMRGKAIRTNTSEVIGNKKYRAIGYKKVK